MCAVPGLRLAQIVRPAAAARPPCLSRQLPCKCTASLPLTAHCSLLTAAMAQPQPPQPHTQGLSLKIRVLSPCNDAMSRRLTVAATGTASSGYHHQRPWRLTLRVYCRSTITLYKYTNITMKISRCQSTHLINWIIIRMSLKWRPGLYTGVVGLYSGVVGLYTGVVGWHFPPLVCRFWPLTLSLCSIRCVDLNSQLT